MNLRAAACLWRIRFDMHTFDKKAIIISIAGHVLLLLAIFALGFTKPVRRGYPRVLTATFVERNVEAGGGAKRVEAAPRPATTPPQPTESKPIPSKIPIPKKPEPKKPEAKRQDVTPPKSPALSEPKLTEQTPANTNAQSPTTSGASSKTGGIIKTDGESSPFDYYLRLVELRVFNHWKPPFRQAGEYSVVVHFFIEKSGKVSSLELEKSSGAFAVDQAAMRAVQNADPLPPLPAGAKEPFGITFEFVAY